MQDQFDKINRMLKSYVSGSFFVFSLVVAVLLSAQVKGQIPSDFSDQSVITGLNFVEGFVFDDNGRAYLWEKGGVVKILDTTGVLLPDPLIDISEEVGDWRDHGMNGFALDPDFLNNGYIYLYYLVDRHHLMNFGTGSYDPSANDYFSATIMRVTRYTAIGADLDAVDPASRSVLLGETKETGIASLHESHSVGSLIFGDDGTLLISSGDGASYQTTDAGSISLTYYAQALVDGIIRPEENVGSFRSQMLGSLNGKILRIDPATGNGVPSNPHYDPLEPRSPASRVWALGLRNPFRFNIRPGSGSSDPDDADPGTLYIGDVGWSQWEDINVCNGPNQNFGWPLFEGLQAQSNYTNVLTFNMDVPNSYYPGTCGQEYYYFQDLIQQATLQHPPDVPQPCGNGQIPVGIETWLHARPSIDYKHGGGPSRTGIWSGLDAAVINIDDPSSPVEGINFGGNASVGGVWYTGSTYPVEYQNTYFHADYVGGWIKNFEFDVADEPVAVQDFKGSAGAVVFINMDPREGCLWYVNFPGEIRKICYTLGVDLPPVPVLEQDTIYGASPLTVNFTGSNSFDPEGGVVSYLWDFGDGSSSVLPDPTHVYTVPGGLPTNYIVKLYVTDDQLQVDSAESFVSINNTPPQVTITSFNDGDLYSMVSSTNQILEANVVDDEHGPTELTYTWQTILHHEDHTHPEPIDHTPVAITVLSAVGCDGEEYYYEIILKVVDDGGLETTVSSNLYPDCSVVPPQAIIGASETIGPSPLSVNFDASNSLNGGDTIVTYAWDLGDGSLDSTITPSHIYTAPGSYLVTLTVIDDLGLSDQTNIIVEVISYEPPVCVGPIGSLYREYWTGVSGNDLNSLYTDPDYPENPSGSSLISAFQGPSNWDNDYGTRVRGYIIAPETGDYIFNITSDDYSEFYISPNADPSLKQLTASIVGWTNPTEFNKFGSQRSSIISLEAGVYYYVEMVHKEGGGDDHFAVYWETPSNSTLTVIPGAVLAQWEDCPPNFYLKAMLDGPYDQNTGLMHDSLRSQGLIPSGEPFTALGFVHAGSGGETVDPSMFNVTGNNALVDWVFVEVRDKTDASMVLETKVGLIQRDGDVVDTNGVARLLFSVIEDDHYIALRHRNHLGIMTLNTVSLNDEETTVNFIDPLTETFGVEGRSVDLGVARLWCGNAIGDNAVKYTGESNDRDAILVNIGGLVPTDINAGYFGEDVNLDGIVKYTGPVNDRDAILITIGGTVPTDTRLEQLP